MTKYRTGEIINVTIKGARVGHQGAEGFLNVFIDGTPHRLMLTSGVTVERAMPEHWPPRPGDLWRDADDYLWFAQQRHDGEIRFRPSYAGDDPYAETVDLPGHLLSTAAPLTLVHRESGEGDATCRHEQGTDSAGNCRLNCGYNTEAEIIAGRRDTEGGESS